ncbi:MAG TPA: rhomboid family intramembrane serine protease [Steroidobacteraceae bacterium]|jgi:membrane associated rhomboid family serine protease|nr:rhomboid family intramembrane serine protease [Steroidobacteraceae bacterium]
MFPAVPPATRVLILVNVALYALELLAPNVMTGLFALWPLGSSLFRPWQLLTYAFLHDPKTILHIFLNMFALYMFGGALERYWGGRRLVLFFLVCVLTAALTQLAVQYPGGAGTLTDAADVAGPVMGASGGVFGVLLAFAWYFPRQRLFVIPIPIPLPAWLFVTLYGLIELFFGVTGIEAGVAHFAHLGGMLGGALCILYWRARHRFRS